MMRKWHNVPGYISVEFGQSLETGEWVTEEPCREIPDEVVDEIKKLFPRKFSFLRKAFDFIVKIAGLHIPIDERYFGMEISFVSSGYYLPSSMYGGSDHLGWPEEGDDERSLNGPVIITCNSICKKLSNVSSQAMFDIMETEIYDTDLRHEDY